MPASRIYKDVKDSDRLDPRLAEQARQGDRAAFDRLSAYYRPLLLGLAFLRTGDSGDAEDLVQEALTLAWSRLPTLENAASFPAWVRVILANCANRWYRRRPSAVPWNEAGALEVSPFVRLLQKERQRELSAALARLPEANRIALLMHVYGGYSYAEIAAQTAVLPSTVEGRIYRAKRRLRSLLSDEGNLFSAPPRPRVEAPSYPANDPSEEKTMPATINPIDADSRALDCVLYCVLFAERFSRLIDGGVSLVRALRSLEEMPAPYGGAAAHLNASLQAGTTLSEPMKEYPDLFSPIYVALVRAGEVGGILEETLGRARTVLTKEWYLANRRLPNEPRLFFCLPSEAETPKEWADLTPYHHLVTQFLFCDTLALLLDSGVPMARSLAVAAELLPGVQRAQIGGLSEDQSLYALLEGMGILPAFALEMIAVGEGRGVLNANLHDIAETFEHELVCRFQEGIAGTAV